MAVVLLLPVLLQHLLCSPVAAAIPLLQSQNSQTLQSAFNNDVVASPAAALTAATCRLVLRGHHAEDAATGPVSITDAVTADQGLTSISLSCDTTPPGLAVPVAVNSTWVSAEAVAAWQVGCRDCRVDFDSPPPRNIHANCFKLQQ
jgi:hypothetical protein